MSLVFAPRSAAVVFASTLVVAGTAFLAGCPIYAADSCAEDPSCRGRNTRVPPPQTDAAVPEEPLTCAQVRCADGYACSEASGRAACVPYDCRAQGCAPGLSCLEDDRGLFVCAAPTPEDCEKTGCITGYACQADAAGKKTCVSTDPNACVTDAECPSKTGAGSLCLGGVCKAPKDLCNDASQCEASESCVDGRCVGKCGAPTCTYGYTCDNGTGLCNGGASVCDDKTPCAGGAACVAGRCVAPCATNGSCAKGFVCVAGGCVADDRPIFFCDKNGNEDGKQSNCLAGSICLHHNCYITCGGPSDTTTCKSADRFPVCKAVTTASGSYNVCGAANGLGGECDPTATPPKSCAAGRVCIDGFCK
jgi:hypothetical protein